MFDGVAHFQGVHKFAQREDGEIDKEGTMEYSILHYLEYPENKSSMHIKPQNTGKNEKDSRKKQKTRRITNNF